MVLWHFILETALTFEKSCSLFFYHLSVSYALFNFAVTTQTHNNSNCKNVASHKPKKAWILWGLKNQQYQNWATKIFSKILKLHMHFNMFRFISFWNKMAEKHGWRAKSSIVRFRQLNMKWISCQLMLLVFSFERGSSLCFSFNICLKCYS